MKGFSSGLVRVLKNKKIMAAILLASIALSFVSGAGYVWTQAAYSGVLYTITASGEMNAEALGAEVRVLSARRGGESLALDSFPGEYDGGLLVIYPYDGEVYFGLDASVWDDFSVLFFMHPWSGEVKIHNTLTSEEAVIDLYDPGSGYYRYTFKPDLATIFAETSKGIEDSVLISVFCASLIGYFLFLLLCAYIVSILSQRKWFVYFWGGEGADITPRRKGRGVQNKGNGRSGEGSSVISRVLYAICPALVKNALAVGLAVLLAGAATVQIILTVQSADVLARMPNTPTTVRVLGGEARVSAVRYDGIAQEYDDFVLNRFWYNDILVGYEHGSMEFAPPRPDTNIEISFVRHPWSGNIQIDNGIVITDVELYLPYNGSYTYQYNPFPGISDTFVLFIANTGFYAVTALFALFFIMFGSCIAYCKMLCDRMLAGTVRIRDITAFFAVVFAAFFLCLHTLLTVSKILAVCVAMLAALCMLWKIRRVFSEKIEYAYVVVSVLVGVCMLLLLPPAHILDEQAHFTNAYQKSYLWNDPYTTLNYNARGHELASVYLPVSVGEIMQRYAPAVFDEKLNISPNYYFYDITRSLNPDQVADSTYYYGNTAKLIIFSYIPAITVSFIARHLNAPPLLIFWVCRAISLLLSTILGYMAIRTTPVFKKLFFLILLFPITVQQSFGINQDWLIAAVCVYFTGLIFYEAYGVDGYITRARVIRIIAVCVAIALAKPGYLPMVFLMFLVPKERFRRASHRLLFIAASFIALPGISLAASFEHGMRSESPTDGSRGIATINGLSLIFENPGFYIRSMLHTLGMSAHGQLLGFFSGFGWYSKYSSELNRLIMQVLAGAFILGQPVEEALKGKKRHQVLYFIVAAMVFGFIYTLFFRITVRGEIFIHGLQPRYFIPVLPLIYASLNNRFININKKWAEHVCIAVILLCNAIGLWTITGFYV